MNNKYGLDKLCDELKTHVENLIELYLSEDDLVYCEKACFLLLQILGKKKVYNENEKITTIHNQIAIASIYLSQIQKSDEDWRNIFYIRDVIEKNLTDIDPTIVNILIITIEGQMGEDMPVQGCRPNPNTPGEVVALALSLAKNNKIEINI